VNNDLEFAQRVKADGVHLDKYSKYPDDVRQVLGKDAIVGYTCGNDILRVRWCEKVNADYLSFCSMYPSSSVDQCEIVPLDTVKEARKIVKIPIFASGGINLENAPAVMQAGANGLAIISAIVKAQEPGKMAAAFKRIIDETHTT
jgi:thiamine-phosphate pyrophosphorylase